MAQIVVNILLSVHTSELGIARQGEQAEVGIWKGVEKLMDPESESFLERSQDPTGRLWGKT